jgi:hypothetical protein
MCGWLHLWKDTAPYRHGPRTVHPLKLGPRDNVMDLIVGELSSPTFADLGEGRRGDRHRRSHDLISLTSLSVT